MTAPQPLPDALRRLVGEEPGPVAPLASPVVRALPAAGWGAVALFVVVALVGLRGDAPRLGPLLTWGPAAVQAVLGFVLVVLALAAAVPGRGAGRGPAALAAAASVAALVAEAVLASRVSGTTPVANPWIDHGPACFALTLLFGASALLVVGLLIARASPLRAGTPALLGGAGCGVLAEGIWRLHCPLADPRHVLTWHLGAVVVLALAALAAGRAREAREAAGMARRLAPRGIRA